MVSKAGILAFLMMAQWLVVRPACADDLKNDLAFIMKHNRVAPHQEESFSSFFAGETREIRLAALGAMRLYQIFISSQDMSACIFSPSCSRFGMRAISEFGLIHGGLMASDRLLRCNGIARKYYPLDLESGRSIDFPVEQYYLKYRPGCHDNCGSRTCSRCNNRPPEGR